MKAQFQNFSCLFIIHANKKKCECALKSSFQLFCVRTLLVQLGIETLKFLCEIQAAQPSLFGDNIGFGSLYVYRYV